ncbi:MAG TPA: Gfo/Idh/MocA family oxidoreductase [Tepidisphaeraceae bacterium]|jgi:predicted dehydrogenase|nr:Gfo/Idh/MocA family oxidoreductase [Tepidisphaeraceae bacterium]
MTDRKLKWGILGTGNIARQFAAGVNASRRGALAVVGSRTQEAAQSFAAAQKVATAVGSYEAVLSRDDVDALYVSLPNSMHKEWTLRALAAGKHVLCEKPFALNTADTEEMFDAAERAGRVLVEAFMYRSHPLTHAVMKTIQSGEIGEVRLIRTSFCYRTTKIDGNVRFAPTLGGGVLMDVGCYCISLARHICGAEPVAVHAFGHKHASGVDDQVAGSLIFPGGVMSTFTCSMIAQADNTASICGSEGYIEIPVPWKPPTVKAKYVVGHGIPPKQDQPAKVASVQPRQTFEVDAGGELYGLEADDFAATVFDGKPPTVSRADTVGNMRVIDEMRRQIGIQF